MVWDKFREGGQSLDFKSLPEQATQSGSLDQQVSITWSLDGYANLQVLPRTY